MITLEPLPASFGSTRDALRHVAVHILARARSQAVGEISLRSTPGGFGTPTFGADATRIRVVGGLLVRETDGPGDAHVHVIEMNGSTLAELASFAQVDLASALDVGHDTPPLGDPAGRLVVDSDAAAALASWYTANSIALDVVAHELPASATPTIVRLWPEHFDVALDAEAAPGLRVNLGGSPGDGFHDAPYAYVGPWTADRPGDPAFWNAPFGAVLAYSDVVESDDPVSRLAEFFLDGVGRLAG